MKYIVNESNNPYYNLAFEEYCFKNLPMGERYLIFWINRPTIVVGKNQNTMEQINKKFVDDNDIDVVRRITGGGAVYHDLGNLNFSIIDEESEGAEIDFEKYNESVIVALDRLGVDAQLSGRNDILIDDRKISGIAQSLSDNRVLNHGTLMFNVNVENMVKSLYVQKDKLVSKGIKSVRSRVTNISEHIPVDMDIIEFRDILRKTLFQVEGLEEEEYILNEGQLEEIDKLYKDRYNKWEWNFGESPKAEYKNYKKFPVGSIDIRFDIEEGKMCNINIFGDFFGSKEIDELIEILDGLRYDEETVEEKLKNIDISNYFGKIDLDDFLDLLFEEE